MIVLKYGNLCDLELIEYRLQSFNMSYVGGYIGISSLVGPQELVYYKLRIRFDLELLDTNVICMC